ncbi:MAG TPA: DUF3037 domain-containing protein [Candidatus Xenobia bacterium]|nr:DUF3037 domain-containing protein [Candidatus Xenobia bacterium]
MLEKERSCEFYLLRYVPNIVRGEFVNLGVLVYDLQSQRLLPPKLLEDFRRVRRLHPWADLDVLAALERQIEAEAPQQNGALRSYLERMQQYSNVLEFSEPKAVLTADAEAELERLFETYVAEPRYPGRVTVAVERSRAWIRSQLNAALRRAGLWQRLDRGVRVEDYTHKGDRFRFDFGWRRNGNLGFLQALALEREVDRAKVLAYTMERIQTRLAAQKLTASCTAIVEAPPENETAELAARILAEQKIAVVPVAGLDAFTAELARRLS